MTDNEIIKALEMCGNSFGCNECPYYDKGNFQGGKCSYNNAKDALDLINRQKEEIERLNTYLDVIDYSTGKIKAEAIKEFAERLKSKLIIYTHLNLNDVIDNLVKEMVGDV